MLIIFSSPAINIYVEGGGGKKMTGETPEVRSDKRKSREKKGENKREKREKREKEKKGG